LFTFVNVPILLSNLNNKDMTKLITNGLGSELINTSYTETTYKTVLIQARNTEYKVTIAKGRYNYYMIKQINHVRGLGKSFATLDMAIDNYKSIVMKTALMQLTNL
jgi:hypothetical protein